MFSERNSIKIYLKTPRYSTTLSINFQLNSSKFELFLFELFYSTHDVYIFNYEYFQL
jgi:hypothetical protein